jgi:hypothetical protein
MRDHGPALLLAAAGVWAMSFVTLFGFGWNDYSSEVVPAYDALTGGHIWEFLKLAPAYGGSLEIRAPFAMIPGLFGGGEQAVWKAVSIPCLVAGALLAVWLVARMRERGSTRLARGTALGLLVFNPVTIYAVQLGHPEELLGAVLCVAAVLAAQRGHVHWSAVMLGLAIVNKQWALVAVGPVLLALPGQRVRAVAIAGGVCAVFYAPLLAPALLAHYTAPATSSTGGDIFQPWQLWWFLGSHGHPVIGPNGTKVGYRTPPALIPTISHPLIVALGLPATLLAARRGSRDPLLLLALLLAARFALDTWDQSYYMLPFVVALAVWESLRWQRPPLFSLAASFLGWYVFQVVPNHATADVQAATFLIVVAPALIALALALYAPAARLPIHLGRSGTGLSRAPAVPS